MKNNRIHLFSILWLCSALLCGNHVVAAASAEEGARSPDVTRSDAYRLLRRGDKLRERREWAEAAQAYYSALSAYQLLAQDAPVWEQDYYEFRLEYCERELAMIVRATGVAVDEWLAEQAVERPAEADEYRVRFYSLQEENRYLRNRLDELEEELELYREMEEIERDRERQRMRQAETAGPARSVVTEQTVPEPREPARYEPRVIPVAPEPVRDPAQERPMPRREPPRRTRIDEPVPMR